MPVILGIMLHFNKILTLKLNQSTHSMRKKKTLEPENKNLPEMVFPGVSWDITPNIDRICKNKIVTSIS